MLRIPTTKSLLVTLLLTAGISSFSPAQTNTFPASGNVGIGTTTPAVPLDVRGTVRVGSYLRGAADLNAYSLEIGGYSPSGTNQKATLFLHHYDVLAHQLRYTNGTLFLEATSNGYGTNSTPNFMVGGQVGIGTTTPGSFRLAVEGKIGAREVQVTSVSPWPDFVFAKNYRLRPLRELEQYLDQNQHLPEVPSAAEVEKNGVNLGEMDALLLKKIEELTLYVIELKKENEQLRSDLNILKK